MTGKDIATNIIAELREHPENWRQMAIGLYDGPKCISGHIYWRIAGSGEHITLDSYKWKQYCRVHELFRVLVGGELSTWNDDPVRTVQDVIDLCERVRDGR